MRNSNTWKGQSKWTSKEWYNSICRSFQTPPEISLNCMHPRLKRALENGVFIEDFIKWGPLQPFVSIKHQWPFQEPICWRYLPYIRPIFQAYIISIENRKHLGCLGVSLCWNHRRMWDAMVSKPKRIPTDDACLRGRFLTYMQPMVLEYESQHLLHSYDPVL